MTTTRDIIDSVISSNGVGGINGASLRGLLNSLITFESLAAVATSSFRSDINQIHTLGYNTPADGGGAIYTRSASVPPHSLYKQAADGSYWVYAPGLPVNFSACGAIADGVIGNYSVGTDNALAMAAAGSYSKVESAAGRGVRWNVAPGIYNFDVTNGGGVGCANCLYDIKQLHIVGYGATFQPTTQTYYVNSWPLGANPLAWGLFSGGQKYGVLIQATAIGDRQVTCIAPSDASKFTIGNIYIIMSDDIQFGGYPLSTGQFEFVRVTAIDPFTGILSLDRAIKWVHSPNFPEAYNYGGLGGLWTANFCGKARIWIMSGIADDGSGYHDWDVAHVYEGFSVLNTQRSMHGDDGHPEANYQSCSGYYMKWLNAPKINGPSPSVCETVIYENCGFTTSPEPDKLVDHLILDGVNAPNISFQSPFNRVTFNKCRIDFLLTGPPKIFTIDQCEIGNMASGETYGASSRTIVRNSFIRSFYGPTWGASTNTNMVDGLYVKYGDAGPGIFTVSKGITPAYVFIYWNIIPGMWVKIPQQLGSSDLGVGIIQYVTEDDNNFYIHTTLPYPSWPSWTTAIPGAVYFYRAGTHRYYNCTGCDLARHMSETTDMGIEPWELSHEILYGNSAASFDLKPYHSGVLTELIINVIQASTVASSMSVNMYFSPNNNPVTLYTTVLNINLGIRGKRIFTQTGFTGLQSGDSWPGMTSLPLNDCTVTMSGGCTPPGNSLIDVRGKWDAGTVGKPIIGTQLGLLTPPM